MKNKITILVSALFCTSVAMAQDIHFSQVLNNPLLVNPACVGGYTGYERVVLNYRSQWSSLGSPFKTMGASFDLPAFQKDGENAHLGFGVNFYSDKAGDSKFGLSQGNISIGGIVPITRENIFTTAIQVGYAQRSANLSTLQWATQYNGTEWDPSLPSYEISSIPSFGYMDLSAGLRYEYRSRKSNFDELNFYSAEFGVAAFHLTRPKLHYLFGNEKMYSRYVVHGSGRIDLPSAYVSVIPYFCVFLQGPSQEINIGMLGRFRLSRGTKITGLLTESALSVGAHYRLNDALVPQIMFELGPFGLGVSYDYNTSSLKTVSRGMGGLEVALKFHDVNGVVFNKRVNSRIY